MEDRRRNSVRSRYRCGRRSVVGRAFGNHGNDGIRIGSMLASTLTAMPTGSWGETQIASRWRGYRARSTDDREVVRENRDIRYMNVTNISRCVFPNSYTGWIVNRQRVKNCYFYLAEENFKIFDRCVYYTRRTFFWIFYFLPWWV